MSKYHISKGHVGGTPSLSDSDRRGIGDGPNADTPQEAWLLFGKEQLKLAKINDAKSKDYADAAYRNRERAEFAKKMLAELRKEASDE